MSEHRAALEWKRTNPDFEYKTFSRNHTVRFPNGVSMPASSAPDFSGDAACVDPEAMLVAALNSCHMLTFLALAARDNLAVDAYTADAVGFLDRNAFRKLAVTRIELRPRVTFAPGVDVPREKLEELHLRAHEACFIANSIEAVVHVLLDD